MLNSHSGISLIVRAVFVQDRSLSGPPQVHNRPTDLSLPSSRFDFWLRLDLGFLEGGDLCLKLIVESFQCFMLIGNVSMVKSCLLPIAI